MNIAWRPLPAHIWGVTAALAAGAAPHLIRLPAELAALWLLAVGWRLRLMLRPATLPPVWLRSLLTLTVGFALYRAFGTVLGREAGSALLVMAAALKLLELQRPRDSTLLVLLAYLLVAVQFMFTRSPWAAAYAAAACVLITAAWIGLNRADPRPWRDQARLATRMLGQALPLMLVLFMLFPRLPGPLWSLPSDAHARTGLSGEMEPGRISDLALSEAVAFRADFAGPVPVPAQRYWRGPVFEFTDGRRWWGATEDTGGHTLPALQTRGVGYRYVVTLEPSGTRWLPALEMATAIPVGVTRLPTFELRTARAVDALRRDELVSFPDYRMNTESAATLRRNRTVPPTLGAKTRALARSWREAAPTEREVITAALRYFNTEAFVYTLNPPALGANPVDEFLFSTRRGFCEHYASAFTLLMRAAGIPARVVTGYQGGEVNTVGGYLIVRQSDAHAWAEVWLADSGWVRVDPTAAVAPERIERRIDPTRASADGTVRFRLDRDDVLARALRHARFAADTLNNGWNQWVLDYGPEQQRALLAAWGLRDAGWRELAWLLSIGIGAAIGLLAALLLRRADRVDPVVRLYMRFRRRLIRHGFSAPITEGPRDLLARIEQTHTPLTADARNIIELYIAMRYAPRTEARQLKALRRAVRRFR